MKWLVTFATGELEADHAPACVVDAETIEDAAAEGVLYLAQEDVGSNPWGVRCEHCEQIAPMAVFVVPLNAGTVLKRAADEWVQGAAAA